MGKPKYYASVQVRVTVELDLHGAEPTPHHLAMAACSQVSFVASRFSDQFGGCSFGEPAVTSIRIEFPNEVTE